MKTFLLNLNPRQPGYCLWPFTEAPVWALVSQILIVAILYTDPPVCEYQNANLWYEVVTTLIVFRDLVSFNYKKLHPTGLRFDMDLIRNECISHKMQNFILTSVECTVIEGFLFYLSVFSLRTFESKGKMWHTCHDTKFDFSRGLLLVHLDWKR